MKTAASLLLLGLMYGAPAAAQMNATAAPVSNSSGSVVNQAVQINPGQYMRQFYGSGIQCDTATLNISPFVSTVNSYGFPNNEYYQEPIYDTSDNKGKPDKNGKDGPDGVPDNPGKILYYKPMRTGYRQNFSHNFGITATFSIPLDRQPIELCKQAARKQVALYEQALAEKRLNYEMGRLKACSEAIKNGYGFSDDSPFKAICADVVLKPIPVEDHTHAITYPQPDVKPLVRDSDLSAPGSAPVKIPVLPFSKGASSQPSS
jgi:hypothetical protein